MSSSGYSSLSGKVLGQFEIMDEIGRGGMATVYRARQRSINRIVAIKVLPQALMHDPAFYERFTREVDVIAHLEHPHILPIYDYGEVDGVPFIAMRYLAGGSMAQYIRRGLPSFEALIKPTDQIGQALDHAHQQGIIHRDLKPANILLDERGNAYLTDFGIARVLDSNLTGSAIIGTPAYMSPEQANALPLDSRSDIYAFGIVLFELLSGREPFEAATPVAMLLKHINEPIPPLSRYRPDTPPAVEDVINRATAKLPADRFSSAGDVAEAYAAAVHADPHATPLHAPGEGSPMAASPSSRPRMTPLPTRSPAPDMPTISPAPAQTRPVSANDATLLDASEHRRSRVPTFIGAAVLVVGVLAAVALAFNAAQPVAPVYVTPTPNQAAAAPTPFTQGMKVEQDGYSLTVPESWAFTDESSGGQLTHLWQSAQDAYIGLTRMDSAPVPADFRAEIDRYEQAHFPADAYSLIDEATAPDGTVRRSYRLSGQTAAGLAAGQTDVFFRAAPTFTALEMYAADRWGSDLTPVFQQVLDSLRLS
ncbi:MAG TPA: protein kinase [Candidatus Limnocylindrales bacterium]|nr:protein kinase [Candidatus Limnocylindrales bacterium]